MNIQNELKNRRLFKPKDLILIAMVLFVALGFYLFFASADSGQSCELILIDGGSDGADLSVSENLNRNKEFSPFGLDEVVVKIENGRVSIIQNNCPEKSCMRQGEISLVGQSIICIPNKLMIRIIGGENTNGIDVYTQ